MIIISNLESEWVVHGWYMLRGTTDRRSTKGLLKNCVGKREAKLYPSLTEKESGVLDLKVSFNIISNTNFYLFVRTIYQIHFMQLPPVALLFLWANTVASFHKKRESELE